MGVNNRQRRAAKQRKRSRERARTTGPGGRADPGGQTRGEEPWLTADDPLRDFRTRAGDRSREWVDFRVSVAVQELVRRGSVSATQALASSRALLSDCRAATPKLVGEVTADLLERLASEAVRGGWPEVDLQELVRRRVGEEHLDLLVVGPRRPAATECSPETLAAQLRIAAALAMVPLAAENASARRGPAPGRPAVSQEKAKRLSKVRALLAKAEATSFDEEADALSAKAQELISRHALERLLEEDSGAASSSRAPSVRRIWLDAPYVRAKATLVNAVARANRCRCVVSESLAVCSVVGDDADLEAVELLSTSLLVQASRSMLRHGRHLDHRGVSRTRSFRASFLTSFAVRIGQRLEEVNQEAIRVTEPGTDLVPVLRNQEKRVDEAVAKMFPHVVESEAAVSNGLGWAAGHAAADLALLDVNAQITPAAS